MPDPAKAKLSKRKHKPPKGHVSEARRERKVSPDLGEMLVVVPFFLFSLCIFLGSFQYRIEASLVPLMSGAAGAVLAGLRLFYLLCPKYGIGEFKQGGLAKEFDDIKDEIAEEMHLAHHDEDEAGEVTFQDEKKAFIYLLSCLGAFLLFGYLVGLFFVIVGCSYYYAYREKGKVIISLVSMYLVVYVILNKLLDAPAFYGLLLGPILKAYRFI